MKLAACGLHYWHLPHKYVDDNNKLVDCDGVLGEDGDVV